jgi:hypothetical protein
MALGICYLVRIEVIEISTSPGRSSAGSQVNAYTLWARSNCACPKHGWIKSGG